MIRIFKGRSLLISNYLNYSSSIPDKLDKAKDSVKNELIFLKKEDEVPITTIVTLKKAALKGKFSFHFLTRLGLLKKQFCSK